jgi:NAD(P)-dependent dehydrogenase (short-subunit alcohol dehydrogenase family)
MDRLSGKVVLVTGAASGIGEAAARMCAREGALVVGLDRVPCPACADSRIADVGDEDQVRAAIEPLGRLDAVVNSAGIAVRKPVADQDAAGWDELMRVNVRGAYLVSRHAIPKMRDRGGSIVHMASVVGVVGVRNRAAYSTTKGAIVALTRNMALDYAADGIRVNCLCPGFTRTPLTRALFDDPERLAKLTALHPLGRLGEPDDIAHAVVFLASDESSWITGQAIAVDGGFTAGHAVDI